MQAILSDNWALESAGEALSSGLDGSQVSTLRIDEETDRHFWEETSYAVQQIEALVGLLSDIVLSDTLVVDRAYTDAWKGLSRQLDRLTRSGVLQERTMKWDEVHRDPRLALITHLCAVPSLRSACDFFWREGSWNGPEQEALGLIVWGTSGYLIRSGEWGLVYSGGHPERRRLLSQSTLAREPTAREVMNDWLHSERTRLFSAASPGFTRSVAEVRLPPVASRVIEEANHVDDLIPVALQMRAHFERYRGWLSEYDRALDAERPREMLKHKRLLESVSKKIEAEKSESKIGFTTVTLGVGWLEAPIPLPYVRSLSHRFGIRGTVSRQVFAPGGQASLKRLLALFGEERSQLGSRVLAGLANGPDGEISV